MNPVSDTDYLSSMLKKSGNISADEEPSINQDLLESPTQTDPLQLTPIPLTTLPMKRYSKQIKLNQALDAYMITNIFDFFYIQPLEGNTLKSFIITTCKKNLPGDHLTENKKVFIKKESSKTEWELKDDHLTLRLPVSVESVEVLSILKSSQDNENIVKFLEMYIIESEAQLPLQSCMIFQYIPGLTFSIICNLSCNILEKYTSFFLIQMNKIHQFLYDNKITHGDFHADNYMYNSNTNTLQLIDFGYAKSHTQHNATFKSHFLFDKHISIIRLHDEVVPKRLKNKALNMPNSLLEVKISLQTLSWDKYITENLSIESLKLMMWSKVFVEIFFKNNIHNGIQLEQARTRMRKFDEFCTQNDPWDQKISESTTDRLCDEVAYQSMSLRQE